MGGPHHAAQVVTPKPETQAADAAAASRLVADGAHALAHFDVGAVAAEAAVLLLVVAATPTTTTSAAAYAVLAGFCKRAAVSPYEAGGLLTSALALLTFDVFAAASSDTLGDAAAAAVLGFAAAAPAAAAAGAGFQLAHSMSSGSRGAAAARAAADDLLNSALCLARVLICWVRYVLYDVQGEAFDMALHHTGGNGAACTPPLGVVASAHADAALVGAHVFLGAAKLLLAATLLWLVFDLFLLRPVAAAAAGWRATRPRHQMWRLWFAANVPVWNKMLDDASPLPERAAAFCDFFLDLLAVSMAALTLLIPAILLAWAALVALGCGPSWSAVRAELRGWAEESGVTPLELGSLAALWLLFVALASVTPPASVLSLTIQVYWFVFHTGWTLTCAAAYVFLGFIRLRIREWRRK